MANKKLVLHLDKYVNTAMQKVNMVVRREGSKRGMLAFDKKR